MSDTDVLLSRAKSALLARDYSLAARLYKTLISENPDEVEYKIQLGNLYMRSGKDDQALDVYRQVRKSAPSNIEVLMAMSGIYRRQKKYDESIAVLEQALVIGADSPRKNAEISYNLGFTYRLMGLYDEAIHAFESVIEENPKDVLAYNHLGAIYALRSMHKKAIESYQNGLKFDPNHPVLQFNIARSYAEIGDIKKALYYYEGALKAKPGWQDAIEEYANLLIKANRVKEADEVVSQALKFNPGDSKIRTAMGNVRNRQYYFESAEDEYKKALNGNGEYKPALTGLAHSQKGLRKFDEAVKTILKASELNPDDDDVLKQSADILLSANQLSKAYEKISKLWNKNKNDPKTVSLLGQYYICRGENDKLASCIKKIQSIAPEYSDVYRDWGHRFMQKGDEKNAEQYLQTAVNSNQQDAEAMLYLGELMEKQERIDEAYEMYKSATQKDRFNSLLKKAEDRLLKSGRLSSMQSAPDLPDSLSPDAGSEDAESPKEDDIFSELEDGREVLTETALPQAQDDLQKVSGSDSQADAPIDSEDEFDFEQFGMENLIEGEDENPISVDDIMQMDETNSLDGNPADFEELIDDGAPVDADDDFMPLGDGDEASVIPDFGGNESHSPQKSDESFFSKPFEDENIDDEDDFFSPKSAPQTFADDGAASKDDFAEPFESQNPERPKEDDFLPYTQEEEPFGEMEPRQKKQPPVYDEDEPVYLDKKNEPGVSDEAIEKLSSQIQQITSLADRANAVAEKALDAVQKAAEKNDIDIDKIAENVKNRLEEQKSDLFKADDRKKDAFEEDDVPAEKSETEEKEENVPVSEDSVFEEEIPQEDIFAAENEMEDEKITSEEENSLPEDEITSKDENPLSENEISIEEEIPLPEKEISAEDKNLIEHAIEMLPTIVAAIENKNMLKKFLPSLELFKKLRELLTYLPEEKKRQFFTSRNRLMLDYIIARLSGTPGLYATARALQKSGLVKVPEGIKASENEGLALSTEVFENLIELSESLEDETLREALKNEAIEMINKF